MTTTTSYNKSKSQIKLEHILHFIKEKGLIVSQLKAYPEYARLNKEFKDTLADVINVLVHETKLHELITSVARSYPSKYYEDLKEYDTLYEVISETYLGLYRTITKSAGNINNKNRIRIDTYDPELFVCKLRVYIHNNIVLDIAKKHGVDTNHIEPITEFFNDDENESCNKLDSVIYNRHNIDSIDFTEDIIRRLSFKPDTCFTFINAVIKRFSRKPVAGYIYLCILNRTYDPRTVVYNLKHRNFNTLFHSLLYDLECEYKIDLSDYNNIIFNADKYIASFRNADDKNARARIDRLASQTRSDVQKLPEFEQIKNYVDVNDKYYCL